MRLFFGVAIPGPVRRELEKVQKPVQQALQEEDSFCLQIRGGGVFPPLGAPRIFWMGLSKDFLNLAKLGSHLDRILEPFGFQKEERDFRPHLSIGRGQKDFLKLTNLATSIGKQFCTLIQNFESSEFVVKNVILYESHLSPTGPRYEERIPFSLGAS